ncbi:MAG: ClpXP protease specificity-enhancing factor [Coxiellaceae bacterium]|jgi:stringent starvation protein B|nr:ClpXP protease specificity-enhancing factor [Coxiellaceae bacterium]
MKQQLLILIKPYLIRAIYEWITDNRNTPYITVDTAIPTVTVPKQYIKNNSITLNISTTATQELLINNETITCKARFSGITHNIYIPILAVTAIYAAENSRGMTFSKEETEVKANKIQFKVIPGGKD